MASQEVNEFLLAHGLHLARLNGFGGDFMRHVGQHGAETHHVAGTGDLEDHGLALARRRRNLDLAEADDENVPRLVALVEQLGAASMAHHDADLIEILECIWREIAEHAYVT